MIVYINVGDWVVVQKVLKPSLKIVKVSSLVLNGQEIPNVKFDTTQRRLQYVSDTDDFLCEYHTNDTHHVTWERRNIRRTSLIRPLTDDERRDLDIYLTGDFEKYPLLINNELLKEVVVQRMKTLIAPDTDCLYL